MVQSVCAKRPIQATFLILGVYDKFEGKQTAARNASHTRDVKIGVFFLPTIDDQQDDMSVENSWALIQVI